MTDEYKVQLDGSRRLISVLDADGVDVSIDPKNPRFIKFLRWCGGQADKTKVPDYYGAVENDAPIYGDIADVVKHCQERSIILHTSAGRLVTGNVVILEHSNTISPPVPNIAIIGVFRAMPAFERTWSEETGGLTRSPTPELYVPGPVFEEMEKSLPIENSDIRRLSDLPVERTFVYVDVSGFSKHPVGHQVLIINALIDLTTRHLWWGEGPDVVKEERRLEASLCIGDGYIFVFRQPHYATYFAAYLANLIEHLIAYKELLEFHFRMGVHTGPVYRFWDASPTGPGRWNYIGNGISDGQRVLGAIDQDQDDVVFISSDTRNAIMSKVRENSTFGITRWLRNRGRRKDKHGTYRRLYEVNHSTWMAEAGALSHLDRWLAERGKFPSPW